MSANLHTVHVRVNDAATGQPTPCRIRVTDAEDRYFAPFGRLTEFATDVAVDVGGNVVIDGEQFAFAYIDGTCEILLPAARVRIAIHKGPEYKPICKEFSLVPGKLALRFDIERWSDVRSEGWYPGDAACFFMTPHAALLETAAEDLAVVNLLAIERLVPAARGELSLAIPNILAFSGQRPALETAGHLVVVNTLNSHPQLGALLLLNCHRVVYPLSFGGHNGLEDWTLADWCDQCHRKGGLVAGIMSLRPGDPQHHELLADCLLGKVDALSVSLGPGLSGEEPIAGLWADLLNCGIRIPLVGGSGKSSNGRPLGQTRTYARLREGDAFNYRKWIDAIRAGRTVVSDGPLLSIEVNGNGPGAVVELPDGATAVHVRAEAKSLIGIERLELIANGKVVSGADGAGPCGRSVLETDLPISESCWLATRCFEPTPWRRSGRCYAQSSPIYIQRGGQPMRPDPETTARLIDDLDYMAGEWVAHKARCDEKQRERLANIFRSARQELLNRSTV